MLSIRFDPQREWWVGGPDFDRLFTAVLKLGRLPRSLEDLGNIADANGGLSLGLLKPSDAEIVATAFRAAAESELTKSASAIRTPVMNPIAEAWQV
jgi:hypothetical protein